MTDQQIGKYIEIVLAELRQEVQDARNEKLCLIEDIFKAKRLAIAMEIPGHNHINTHPGKSFDDMYDCDIEQLQLIWATVRAEIKQKARQIAGIDCCNAGGCDCE